MNLVIEVLYFADLKDITGKNKEVFNLQNSNLLELLNQIFKNYSAIKELIWNDKENNLKNNISVAVNDEIINDTNKISKSISDGDRIAFLLPISGG